MIKSCIIIPYYGKWPGYFNLYLESCRLNHWIDILFFTDLEKPENSPGNVRFIRLSLEEFKEIIRMKLALEPAINNSYKICDIRPAFGLLFREYIKDYTYWGWGDIDLIYGELKSFFPQGFWNGEYDVISFRKRWVSGAFALMKNTEQVCNLFRQNSDYKTVFEDHKHYSFGECGKKWTELQKGADIRDLVFEVSNMSLLVRQAQENKTLKCFFENRIREFIFNNERLRWSQGKIFTGDEELMMYHFITEKRSGLFKYPEWKNTPSHYYIDRFGFFMNTDFYFVKRFLRAGWQYSAYWKKRIVNALN